MNQISQLILSIFACENEQSEITALHRSLWFRKRNLNLISEQSASIQLVVCEVASRWSHAR